MSQNPIIYADNADLRLYKKRLQTNASAMWIVKIRVGYGALSYGAKSLAG